MCVRALARAPVSRGDRHRPAPFRFAYSMLVRAVTPQITPKQKHSSAKKKRPERRGVHTMSQVRSGTVPGIPAPTMLLSHCFEFFVLKLGCKIVNSEHSGQCVRTTRRVEI